MKTLNIVGCGRVGQTLGRLFHRSGVCRIQDLHSRRPASAVAAAAFIGAGRPVATLADLGPADLWLLAVPDTAIAPVAEALAREPLAPGLAFHCSGYWPSAILEPLAGRGWQVASVHPVLSFADPALAVEGFAGTACGVEGEARALAILEPLLRVIGAHPFPVAGDSKALYHAAAVIASNFTVVIQSLAREAWLAAGVPAERIVDLQSALVRGTVENVLALGPAAITGPAARGDAEVVRHQAVVVANWHPEAGELYRRLSTLARRLAVHGGTQAPTADEATSGGRPDP